MTYMTLADKALHDESLTKEECHSVLNTTNDDLLALLVRENFNADLETRLVALIRNGYGAMIVPDDRFAAGSCSHYLIHLLPVQASSATPFFSTPTPSASTSMVSPGLR